MRVIVCVLAVSLATACSKSDPSGDVTESSGSGTSTASNSEGESETGDVSESPELVADVDGVTRSFNAMPSTMRGTGNQHPVMIQGSASEAEDALMLMVHVLDEGPGTYSCVTDNWTSIAILTPEGTFTSGTTLVPGPDCTIEVSENGGPGEVVAGTFNGTLTGSPGTTDIEIANGRFWRIRED